MENMILSSPVRDDTNAGLQPPGPTVEVLPKYKAFIVYLCYYGFDTLPLPESYRQRRLNELAVAAREVLSENFNVAVKVEDIQKYYNEARQKALDAATKLKVKQEWAPPLIGVLLTLQIPDEVVYYQMTDLNRVSYSCFLLLAHMLIVASSSVKQMSRGQQRCC